MLTHAGCVMARWESRQVWWQWTVEGKRDGACRKSAAEQEPSTGEVCSSLCAAVWISPGASGVSWHTGLSFKSTSTDLWAGWRPIKPAAILHGGSL